ncbi:MAG TPA: nuclear transport factor 2 family protein [Thermoleophilaceae bacterium]
MAVAAFLAPVGCSIGADKEPQPVSGVPKQIAATVDRLGRAIADGDFAEVCDRLFTPAARSRAGGSECAKQMTAAAEGVRNPTIEIRGIDVKGDRAVVKVATTAEGQARLIDTLELRREGRRWLVEALR